MEEKKDKIPKDYNELVRDWSGRIRSTLKHFGVYDPDLLNDLEQEVYVRMLKYDIINASDPEKGTFATYVFRISRTIALNYHRSKKTDILSKAEPLTLPGEQGEEFTHPEVDKLVLQENDADEKSDIEEFFELFYEEIKNVPMWESESPRGKSIKSLSKVCDLMGAGYSKSEIARIFLVSSSAVSGWFKKMRLIGIALKEKLGET